MIIYNKILLIFLIIYKDQIIYSNINYINNDLNENEIMGYVLDGG
jgi:hypothetical protein